MGATRALIRANRSGRSPTASGSSASPTFGDGEGSVCAHRNHDARTKRAYVLADNKLAMNAGWDEELLAEELKGLLEIDLDFDIGVTAINPGGLHWGPLPLQPLNLALKYMFRNKNQDFVPCQPSRREPSAKTRQYAAGRYGRSTRT